MFIVGEGRTDIHIAKMANQKHITTKTTTKTTESECEAISEQLNGICLSCENQDGWQFKAPEHSTCAHDFKQGLSKCKHWVNHSTHAECTHYDACLNHPPLPTHPTQSQKGKHSSRYDKWNT
jgi:hypothetical protein